MQLIDYLTKFHEARAEDEQFADEKDYLIKQIKVLSNDPHFLTFSLPAKLH